MIKVKPSLLISLVLVVDITSCPLSARAQVSPGVQVASDPPKPSPQGDPSGREPAGSRGPCEKTNTPFTPLLPVTKSGFSGYTLTGHPTFWFYVPYKTAAVSEGKFVLEDREGNTFYRNSFKLPQTPGFVSVSIPTTEKALDTNKQYSWILKLNCASPDANKPDFVFHRGTVQRVNMPGLGEQLKTAKLEDRINLYVKNRIWYDVSTDLAQIRSLPQPWRDLLKATGLEYLEQEPVAGSVVAIEK